MIINVDLNELYEEKTSYYRKLDELCETIHEFKQLQDIMFNKNRSDAVIYEKPEFLEFSRMIDPEAFSNSKKNSDPK